MWTWTAVLLFLYGAGPAERCSMRMLITERPDSGTLILARALPDTFPAGADAEDFIPKFGFPPVGLTTSVAWGQRFEVLAVTGTSLDVERGSVLTAVPWEYRDDCRAEPWTGSSQWVEPHREVLFNVSPTRVSGSAEITVDVFGWHNPYPAGEFWKYEGRQAKPTDRSQWLSAREYYDLLLALPAGTWWDEPDRASVFAAVEAAFARSDRYATTFPGTEILALYRRWAATGRED